MDPLYLALLLFAAGLVFFAAELVLPAHGLVGVLGGIALVASVVAFFRVGEYVGLGVLVGLAFVGPIVAGLWVKMWPRTPLGRRMVLQTVAGVAQTEAVVRAGEQGVALSELRPGGMCEFDGKRLEAHAEIGMIAAGDRVVAVGVSNGRLLVRPA
jgi:membrane-bound ClpP family serine protease